MMVDKLPVPFDGPAREAAIEERIENDKWVISVPVNRTNAERVAGAATFELCSPKTYGIADNAQTLKSEMLPLMSADAQSRGVYPIAQKIELSETTPQRIFFRLPSALPNSIKEIVRDVISSEAKRGVDFSQSMFLMNVRLEEPTNVRSDTLTFHHDFENYARASVYVVSGRPTTLGSNDEALKIDEKSALEKGLPVFSLLPNRLYRWNEYFVHATPQDRFKTSTLRPFVIIGFAYAA